VLLEGNVLRGFHTGFGSAVLSARSNPIIRNNEFYDLLAGGSGAAIYLDQSSPLIEANTMFDLQAADSAAIGGYGDPIIRGNHILDNFSDEHDEGAVYVEGNVTIVGNRFVHNGSGAISGGPGTYLIEDNVFVQSYECIELGGSTATIRRNHFTNVGEGVSCRAGTVTITDNVFSKVQLGVFLDATDVGIDAVVEANQLLACDEAIRVWGPGAMTVRGNIIRDSTWTAMSLYRTDAVIDSNLVCRTKGSVWSLGAVRCEGGAPLLVGNTIAANEHAGIECVEDSQPVIANTILWDNPEGAFLVTSGNPNVTYSDVQGGWPGIGNIDLDPEFLVPGHDFRLAFSSPCLETGDPAAVACARDADQNPRALDGDLDRDIVVDMGALEANNVHLEMREPPREPAPRGLGGLAGPQTIVITATGKTGWAAYLFVGLAAGEIHHPWFGCLFLDLSQPWRLLPWGMIPNQRTVTLPEDFPAGASVIMQVLGLDTVAGVGNFSNGVTLSAP
jgi:hypothetical protein